MAEILILRQTEVDETTPRDMSLLAEKDGVYTPDFIDFPDTQNDDHEQYPPINGVTVAMGSRAVAIQCKRSGGCIDPSHCGARGCMWE